MSKSTRLKTALIAVGGSLAAVPAAGLELGDVKVHSSLGQPLRASIAYALAPNESVSDSCVSLLGGPSTSGLPNVSRGSMIVADGVIAITGSTVVQEPRLAMRISIRCPYTPQLTREYMLFVDPVSTTAAPAPATVAAPAAAEAAVAVAAPSPAPAAAPAPRVTSARPAVDTTPIAVAARYHVQFGDTLSGIAQRIENRPVGLWQAVNAIYAANPDAFLDNDVNKLKAGTWLDIPDFGAGRELSVAPQAAPSAQPAADNVTANVYAPAQPATAPAATVTEAIPPAVTVEAEAAVAETAATPELQPGDIILDADLPPADMAGPAPEPEIVIPDTAVEAPAATSSNPNVPTAVIRTSGTREEAKSTWPWWLGGGLLAAIGGLLLFGRFSGRFGSRPIGDDRPVARPRRESGDTERLEAIGDVDLDVSDDSPTAENLVLDANLEIGTGLSKGSSVEVASDFAFASTTSLDIELPEEMSSGHGSDTDIIPPLNIDPDSILEEEVLPEDDDYDMSVIVDATQMPDPDEVTERDLEAIAVPDDDDELITGDYTVSQEADYKIIEQDYEDEMTATQALNAEIQRAAEELASRMDDEDMKEMSLASVHELDVTVQLRGKNDDAIGDDDDTGVNPTINMDTGEDVTANIDMEADETVEMPKSGKAG